MSFPPAERLARAAAYLRQGDFAAAEAQCRALLEHVPRRPDARLLLGLALNFQRRCDEAVAVFEALAQDEPQEASYWANLGTARRGARNYEGALQAYGRALLLGLSSADLLYNVGLVHIDRLDFESARAVLARAAAMQPRSAEIRYWYANACAGGQHNVEALQALEGWQELEGLDAQRLADIGLLLLNLGAGAQLALQRAAAMPNPTPRAQLALAQACERTNRIPQARMYLDQLHRCTRSITLSTDVALAEAQLAAHEGDHARAVRLLEAALPEVVERHRRHFLLFALARSLDALGRHDAAFATLAEAHQSQVAYLRLCASGLSLFSVPVMAMTARGTDPGDVSRWDHAGAPPAEQSPVFIVGFPRSGTTLLELILDAHPLLVSMDEQPFLQRALLDIQSRVPYPDGLANLTPADLNAVRAAYWQSVAQHVQLAPGCRLVDKNPLNILRLPVIHRLFPHARILLAVRHPCDVLLSCYAQAFRAPDFALVCADLPTLATGYLRTFDAWYRDQAVLGATVREVRYEALVADFEIQVRAISDFLDLPWDERMLSPSAQARAKGFISTPSYSQVVQPVSGRSVGRWRAYRRHFVPILARLQPYLSRWSYEA
jgi:tetratricopeptide (TPR) repeat protein